LEIYIIMYTDLNTDKIPKFVPRDIKNTIDFVEEEPVFTDDGISDIRSLTDHDKARLNLLNHFVEMRDLELQIAEELRKLLKPLAIPTVSGPVDAANRYLGGQPGLISANEIERAQLALMASVQQNLGMYIDDVLDPNRDDLGAPQVPSELVDWNPCDQVNPGDTIPPKVTISMDIQKKLSSMEYIQARAQSVAANLWKMLYQQVVIWIYAIFKWGLEKLKKTPLKWLIKKLVRKINDRIRYHENKRDEMLQFNLPPRGANYKTTTVDVSEFVTIAEYLFMVPKETKFGDTFWIGSNITDWKDMVYPLIPPFDKAQLMTYVASKLRTGIPFVSNDDALTTIRQGIDNGELAGKIDMTDPRLSTSNVEECYAIYCQKIDSFDRNNPNYMKSAGVRIDDFDNLSEQYPKGWIVQTNMVFNYDAKAFTFNEDTTNETGELLTLPGQVEKTKVKWRTDKLSSKNLKVDGSLWGISQNGSPVVITIHNQNTYFKEPLIIQIAEDNPDDLFPEMNEDQVGNMNCVLASVTLLDYVDEISKTAESNSFDGNIPELVEESWNNKMRLMELESQERYIRTNAGVTVVSTKTSAFGGERSNEQAYLDRTVGHPSISQSAWSNALSDAQHVWSDEVQYWKAEAEAGASQDWPINQANTVKIMGKEIPIPAVAIADGFATYFKIEGVEQAISDEIATLRRELTGPPEPTPERKRELEAKIAELERLGGENGVYQYVKGGDQYPGYIVNPALWNRSLDYWENEILQNQKLGKNRQKLVNILKAIRGISDDIVDICCLVSDLTVISSHFSKVLPALKLGLLIAVNIGIPVSVKMPKSNEGTASTKAADSFGRAINNAIQSLAYMVKYSLVVFLLNSAMAIIRKVIDEVTSSASFFRCLKTAELEEFIMSAISDIGRKASQKARDAMTSYYDDESEEKMSIVVRKIKIHTMLKLVDAVARAIAAGELCAQKSTHDTNKYEEVKALIDAATEKTLGELEQSIMAGDNPAEIHKNLVNQLALEYAKQNDILSPEASAAKVVATLDAMYPTDKELERLLTHRLGVNPSRTSEILNNRTGVTPTGISFRTDDSILSIAKLISPCAKNISQDDLVTIIKGLQQAGVV